jgi:hypothetical protein
VITNPPTRFPSKSPTAAPITSSTRRPTRAPSKFQTAVPTKASSHHRFIYETVVVLNSAAAQLSNHVVATITQQMVDVVDPVLPPAIFIITSISPGIDLHSEIALSSTSGILSSWMISVDVGRESASAVELRIISALDRSLKSGSLSDSVIANLAGIGDFDVVVVLLPEDFDSWRDAHAESAAPSPSPTTAMKRRKRGPVNGGMISGVTLGTLSILSVGSLLSYLWRRRQRPAPSVSPPVHLPPTPQPSCLLVSSDSSHSSATPPPIIIDVLSSSSDDSHSSADLGPGLSLGGLPSL